MQVSNTRMSNNTTAFQNQQTRHTKNTFQSVFSSTKTNVDTLIINKSKEQKETNFINADSIQPKTEINQINIQKTIPQETEVQKNIQEVQQTEDIQTNTTTFQVSSENTLIQSPTYYEIEDGVFVRWISAGAKPVSITDGLKKLTDEQKQELQQKYDIQNMKENSKEYYRLMNDLYNMGVISDYPLYPPNVTHIDFDKNGNVIGIMWKLPEEPQSVKGWFESSLEYGAEKYKNLLEQSIHSAEDKIFMNLYESQKNLFDALQSIFGEL